MATSTWLITGASRGIGLALVQLLVADAANVVIAAVRAPGSATALNDLGATAKGKLHVIPLDVGDAASIKASVGHAKAVLEESGGLDYLVNNAAIYDKEGATWTTMDADVLLRSFQINTVGPALTSQAYLPYLSKPGKRGVIMHISSTMGSLGSEHGTRGPAYCMSKTALNMLAYKQARESTDLIPFVVCPGWVSTDMGGASAPVTPVESATALLKLAKRVNKEHAGKFLHREGTTIPW